MPSTALAVAGGRRKPSERVLVARLSLFVPSLQAACSSSVLARERSLLGAPLGDSATAAAAAAASSIAGFTGRRGLLVMGASGCGKCWGADTRLLLADGRSMAVQDIVQTMDEGRMVQLMGDDGTPRNTVPGTQTMGNTQRDQEGATYRVRSNDPVRSTWSDTHATTLLALAHLSAARWHPILIQLLLRLLLFLPFSFAQDMQ